MSAPSLKANEPSMEEILASIRRIISDDQDKLPEPQIGDVKLPDPAPARAEAPPPPSEPEPDDVLDLATVAAAQPPPVIEAADIEFREVVVEPEPEPEPVAAAPRPEPPRAPPPPRDPVPDQLLSPQADAAVSSAFNALASTILTGSARTLEDLVKDMMRPMLKVWLDDNLPALVERLVRAEIERVSRGPRG